MQKLKGRAESQMFNDVELEIKKQASFMK
jgi:hypothetical protein